MRPNSECFAYFYVGGMPYSGRSMKVCRELERLVEVSWENLDTHTFGCSYFCKRLLGITNSYQRTVCDTVTVVTPGGILVIPLCFFLLLHLLSLLHPPTPPSPHHSSTGGNWAHEAADPLPPKKKV